MRPTDNLSQARLSGCIMRKSDILARLDKLSISRR